MAGLRGDSRNAFVSSLRQYDYSGTIIPIGTRRRGASSSPSNRGKKDFLVCTMTTFSEKHRHEMNSLHEYQHRLDMRLSQPKYKPACHRRYCY